MILLDQHLSCAISSHQLPVVTKSHGTWNWSCKPGITRSHIPQYHAVCLYTYSISCEPTNPIASILLIEATPAAGITTSPAADFPFWGTRSWHPQRGWVELGAFQAESIGGTVVSIISIISIISIGESNRPQRLNQGAIRG